jgi:hypothetical protein
MDEAAVDDGKSHIYEDVDAELMDAAAYDVDDAHDDELVTVYDKENPVIAIGKLFPNMGEFRMCFKNYVVKKEFDAKTMWTDRKKFYARCRDYDGGTKPCKWYICSRRQPDGSTIRVNQIPFEHTCITSSQRVSTMTSQFWVAKKITSVLAKTPNTTAKKLKTDLEKDYPVKVNYTTVWKEKHGDEEDLRWRFPSPAGCREELLDPPDLGSTATADRNVFWKSDRVLRFFPSGGLYSQRGGVRSGPG